MFDSVTVSDLPEGGDLYLGYVNGKYKNFEAVYERFHDKQVVSVATQANFDAVILDCERYDATPEQCPGWAQRQRERGQPPTIYTTAGQWAAVRSEFHRQGVAEPEWFIAKYDNIAQPLPGAVAKQYGGSVAGHYDLSIVSDYWLGVDMLTKDEMDLLKRIDKNLQEVHDAVYVGDRTYGVFPGMEGMARDTWKQVMGK